MFMKKFSKQISVLFFLAVSSTYSQAAPLSGTLLVQDGSTFLLGGGAFGPAVDLLGGSDGGIRLGEFQNFVLDPDEPHPPGWGGATGAGYGATPVIEANMILPFLFGSPLTYMGTNPVSYQSGLTKLAPSADVDLTACVGNICAFTADLSAWEVMWNGSAFEQGPRPDNAGPFTLANGTYDLVTHEYVLDWDSQIKGGPFNGANGAWHLEGVHVVPIPAAIWLFGSGFLGLTGIARRKAA